jgi:uncharacterized protein YdaU (DUF1376 family)
MEPKVDIWMPLAIGDYLADTSHLDTTQHGAYLLMLMHYWRKGPLPNDMKQLASISKLPPDAWSINQAVLMQFFGVGDDGMLHQKRCDLERERWMQKRTNAQGKALRAAETRWAKTRSILPIHAPSIPLSKASSLTPGIASGIASGFAASTAAGIDQAMPGSCPSPSPLPIPAPLPASAPMPIAAAATGAKAPESAQNADSSSSLPLDGLRLDGLRLDGLEPAEEANGRPERLRTVRGIFAYYCEQMGRNAKIYTLTPLRTKKAMARLEETLRITDGDLGRAAVLVKAVIDQVAASDFHMGLDPKTGGKSYCDWEDHIFRSPEQFQKWLQRVQEAIAREEQNA